MDEREALIQTMALTSNATMQAFVLLVKCLLSNGALKPGQFSGLLKETYNHPDAEYERLDYKYFQRLANLLDEVGG